MKTTTFTGFAVAALALVLVAGCGGGGGGGSTPSSTQAIVTLSTVGTLPAGAMMGGIDVAITIPTGVVVKASVVKATKAVQTASSGALTPSGVAAGPHAMAVATGPTAGVLNVGVTNPAGFGVGEFIALTFDIAAGSTVAASDFSAGTLTAYDLNGAPITGISAGLSAVLQ